MSKKMSDKVGKIGYIEDKLYIVTQDGLQPITDHQADKLLAINNIPVRLTTYSNMKKSSRKPEDK